MREPASVVRSGAAILVIALFLAGAGCCCAPPAIPIVEPIRVTCSPTAAVAAEAAATSDARLAAAADATLTRAREAEPATTALVQDLAAGAGGEVVGLEHRLKSRTSAIGKVRRLMDESPGVAPEDIVLHDALRYTIVIADQPAGHHDASVRTTLVAFEARGDHVVKVKNYWPRGDSYSGTNCVLRMDDGLHWEVQFHTPDSYRTKSETHHDYERMRAPDTPRDEKRRLFEAMSALWDRIPIPEGILEEGSLHDVEHIATIPSP